MEARMQVLCRGGGAYISAQPSLFLPERRRGIRTHCLWLDWGKKKKKKNNITRASSSALECSPRVGFELGEGQVRESHRLLPSGLCMEVIVQKPESGDCRPPLVFVHGSFHAAWCWAVHWLPFFAARGHPCYALSLLGQGESDVPENPVAGTLESHARDIAHFIKHEIQKPPVLVGHSIGGLIVQQYISYIEENTKSEAYVAGCEEPYSKLIAAVLICSVPPTGNGGLVQRYLFSRPLAAIKVTLSLAAKAFAYSLSLCQESFFSQSMPQILVEKYQGLLKHSSTIPLFNLRELNASLPVASPPAHAPPVFVIGAENDLLVDEQGVEETAAFYGTEPVILKGLAHDIMLDTEWEHAAQAVAAQLASVC